MILDRTAGRSLAALARLVVLSSPSSRRRRPSRGRVALSPADRVALRPRSSTSSPTSPTCRSPSASGARRSRLLQRRGAARILWLGEPRAAEFVAWLRNAAEDGLDPAAYPADQLDEARRCRGRDQFARHGDRRAPLLRRLPAIRLRPPGRPLPAPQGRSGLLPGGAVDRSARRAHAACASRRASTASSSPGSRRRRNTPISGRARRLSRARRRRRLAVGASRRVAQARA